MSAGMNKEEARLIANKMRFVDAVYNALHAKCVPYRKATKIKLNELLDIAKDVDEAKSKGCDEVELSLYCNGWNDCYNKAIDDMVGNLIANSRTESIDGKLMFIVTEERIKTVANEMKKRLDS